MTATKKSSSDLFVHAAREPEIVELPSAKFIVVEGAGAPEHAAFQAAIAALYGVAYTIKFTNKKAGGADYKVPPRPPTVLNENLPLSQPLALESGKSAKRSRMWSNSPV